MYRIKTRLRKCFLRLGKIYVERRRFSKTEDIYRKIIDLKKKIMRSSLYPKDYFASAR